MTLFPSKPESINQARPPASTAPSYCPLDYMGVYNCPVCRHGQIESLTLMEAFSCNFCRHIFTADLKAQSIQMADSVQPTTWYWTGARWRQSHRDDGQITALLWGISAFLVIMPPGLIWLSSYLFPPLEAGPGARIPQIWLLLTAISHFTWVSWLLIEHYQPAWYITTKIRLRRFFEHYFPAA